MSGLVRAGHTPTKYVFIDGAYLSTFASNKGKEWFGRSAELDYNLIATQLGGVRTFYYDCLPARAQDRESESEFQGRLAERQEFFDSLRRLPGWHVSEGLAKWRKKKGTTQKEVDILIAVDMLTHTYRKNMDQILFVAGDLDFRPLVEAIVREGMYITLRYGQGSIAEELLDAVDYAQEMTPFELLAMCTDPFQRSTPIPQVSQKTGAPPGPVLEYGRKSGKLNATMYGPDPSDTCCKIALDLGRDMQRHYRDSDANRLRTIFEACHGVYDWTTAKASNAE
jgi:uncharacterized LabA/DUF88 family protein